MHVQLKRAGVGGLLGQVGGKSRTEYDSEQKPALNVMDDDEINQSPVSSEDEAQQSEPEIVDIVRKEPASRPNRRANNDSTAAKRQRQESGKVPSRSQPTRSSLRTRFKDEEPNRSIRAGSKRKIDEVTKDPSIDEDEMKFDSWTQGSSQRTSRLSQTYGGRNKISHSAPENIHAPAAKKGFKRPGSLSPSPEDSQTEAKSKFKNPRNKLSRLASSQDAQENGRTFRAPRLPPRPEISNSDAIDDSTIDSHNGASLFSRNDVDAFSDLSSILSSPPPEADMDEEELAFTSTQNGDDKDLDRCPMCHELIDREALELFTNGQVLRWRDKAAFCRSHQRQEVEDEWNSSQYPTIDWDHFDQRLQSLHGKISTMLKRHGRKSSFRRTLEEKVESGRVRKTFRNVQESNEQNVVPGYYGSKGANIMHEHLLSCFGNDLKEMAKDDLILRSAGVSNYIQRVLIPELAIILIKEDMKLGPNADEAAKEIMMKSASVGDLINPQEEDYIKKEPGENTRTGE